MVIVLCWFFAAFIGVDGGVDWLWRSFIEWRLRPVVVGEGGQWIEELGVVCASKNA